MGYYTRFSLSVEPQNDDVLSAAVPEGYSFYKSGDDMVSGDSLKWYEHEADLLAASAKHPCRACPTSRMIAMEVPS